MCAVLSQSLCLCSYTHIIGVACRGGGRGCYCGGAGDGRGYAAGYAMAYTMGRTQRSEGRGETAAAETVAAGDNLIKILFIKIGSNHDRAAKVLPGPPSDTRTNPVPWALHRELWMMMAMQSQIIVDVALAS